MDKKILEETKKLLESEKNMSETVISVYDLSKLFKSTYTNVKTLEFNLGKKLSSLGNRNKIPVDNILNLGYYARFLPEMNLLNVGLVNYNRQAFYRKEEGDLKSITTVWEPFGKEVLGGAGNILSDYYDEFVKHSDFYLKSYKKINPVNSCFIVEIDSNGVTIIMKDENDDFKLTKYVYKTFYCYNSKSKNVISVLRGNEEEVLKRIFVKIKDCPEWSQEPLRQLRQKQLRKEEKLQFVKKLIP